MTTDPTAGVELPTASDRHGNPGHDQALDRANAIRLLTLRTEGKSYAAIAEEVGYTDASSARQALLRALDRHEAENAAQLRDVENLRLDADEQVLRSLIGDTALKAGDRIRAVDARTRLSARRARMNGLDAPVQVTLSAGVAAELSDALTELGDLMGVTVPGEVLASHDEPVETPEA